MVVVERGVFCGEERGKVHYKRQKETERVGDK